MGEQAPPPGRRDPGIGTNGAQPGQAGLRVWDLPTRLFHWALVLLLGISWFTGSNGLWEWHALSGYLLAGLLLFRLIWGILGSQTARFGDFLRGPRTVLAYLADLFGGRASTWHGHNPAGGIMVVLLLLVVAVQVGSGLFASDDILFEGPLHQFASSALAADLTRLHHLNFDILLGLAGLHVLAVLGYRFLKKQDLILPMITGRARMPLAGPEKRRANQWLGLAVLAAALALAVLFLRSLEPF